VTSFSIAIGLIFFGRRRSVGPEEVAVGIDFRFVFRFRHVPDPIRLSFFYFVSCTKSAGRSARFGSHRQQFLICMLLLCLHCFSRPGEGAPQERAESLSSCLFSLRFVPPRGPGVRFRSPFSALFSLVPVSCSCPTTGDSPPFFNSSPARAGSLSSCSFSLRFVPPRGPGVHFRSPFSALFSLVPVSCSCPTAGDSPLFFNSSPARLEDLLVGGSRPLSLCLICLSRAWLPLQFFLVSIHAQERAEGFLLRPWTQIPVPDFTVAPSKSWFSLEDFVSAFLSSFSFDLLMVLAGGSWSYS
jgi:hypothetical protein